MHHSNDLKARILVLGGTAVLSPANVEVTDIFSISKMKSNIHKIK
jgi:hypothetical protein